MKKMVLGIILSLSVTFLIGISNVSAISLGSIGYDDIDLSGITSLQYYYNKYSVHYVYDSFCDSSNNCFNVPNGLIYLQFYYNYDAGFYNYQDSNSQYYNSICSSVSEYGCFSYLISSYSNSRRLGASYYSLDNGSTWVFNGSANVYYTTHPMKNYVIYTTAQLRTRVNGSQINVYDSGYTYYGTSDLDLLINIDRVSSFSTNLIVTLDDVGGQALGGDVLYSYNGTEYYSLGIDEAGEVATLPVYTNGDVYFKIVDSEDSILYTEIYNVTGMPSINGYSVYEIPSGNNQIYISNISSSSGKFYIPYGMKGFSDNFNYLSIDGELLGVSPFNYLTYEDLSVDTVSGNDNGLVSVSYDFSSLSNVKIISFNHSSDDSLVIYIPTGYYVDYVDLTSNLNYHCEGDTNISNSTNLAMCRVKFNVEDNGVVTEVIDENLDASSVGNLEYFGQVTTVIKTNMPILKGITKDFTLFINSLNFNLKYGFYFLFAVFFTFMIVKVIKI